MNWKVWNNEPNVLDEPIEKVLEELRVHDPNTKEFAANLTYLERLTELKAETRRKMRISPDTLVTTGGTLLGILLIIAYEQKHAMVSKGFGFKIPSNSRTS
jgi:hypothetical protein